ncbi:hypothetical protein PD5205_02041 [Xanthomonas fragariae]|uniref:Uncharacterized protein n=1 Tax=Xanthomonas fragariae TaxID=48664 RepID=A0A1Y6HPI7_9XANT|nr:hypothetical protein PD5205_02041 [Xanthomonas fragariae]
MVFLSLELYVSLATMSMTDIFMSFGLITSLNRDVLEIHQDEKVAIRGGAAEHSPAVVILRRVKKLTYIGGLKGLNLNTMLVLSRKSIQFALRSRRQNRLVLATLECICVKMEPPRYSG